MKQPGGKVGSYNVEIKPFYYSFQENTQFTQPLPSRNNPYSKKMRADSGGQSSWQVIKTDHIFLSSHQFTLFFINYKMPYIILVIIMAGFLVENIVLLLWGSGQNKIPSSAAASLAVPLVKLPLLGLLLKVIFSFQTFSNVRIKPYP